MTNIIPFPEKKKKPSSKSTRLESSLGVPEFNIDQDVTDEYLVRWANWMFLQDLTGQDGYHSIKQDEFANTCFRLEELGLELLATDSSKFRQLEKEINELIIKNTP